MHSIGVVIMAVPFSTYRVEGKGVEGEVGDGEI